MIVFKASNVTVTIPTSVTKVKTIHFNHLVDKLFNIIPSIGNGNFNVEVAFNGNGFGDGNLVYCDKSFNHCGNKIQEDSLAVKLFLEFIFSGISLDGLNFAGAGIGLSPEFADFDGSFHTSANSLTDF
jgi:hypothetical protein